MPLAHGSRARFWVADESDVLTELTRYLTRVQMTREEPDDDDSSLGEIDESYLAGMGRTPFVAMGKFDPTADRVLLNACGTNRAFEYYPQGRGSGRVKYSGTILCETYEVTSDFETESTWTANFRVTDDLERTVL